VLRAILTFIVVFAVLATLFGVVGWAGPLEVLLLGVVAAAVTVVLGRVGWARRDVG
jgi:hypothetical protein